jgi:hypothetical protein
MRDKVSAFYVERLLGTIVHIIRTKKKTRTLFYSPIVFSENVNYKYGKK